MSVDWGSADLGATDAPLPRKIGPYTIHGRLGRGGMGVVLDASDGDGTRVALKLVRPTGSPADQRVLVARLLREAAAIARIDHRGVVRLERYGSADGAVYLAMELVTGVTLQALRGSEALDARALLHAAIQLLETLAHLHEAGVVHRDIKPNNVLIDRTGRVVLADFGIAWFAEAAGITQPGEVIGSVGYLSPECFEGAPTSPASDLYALGRTLFEAAAVIPRPQLPVDVPLLERFERRLDVDWRRFGTDRDWPVIRPFIERLIAPAPEDRFSSAHEALEAARALRASFSRPKPDPLGSAIAELPLRSFWAEPVDDEHALHTLPPVARARASKHESRDSPSLPIARIQRPDREPVEEPAHVTAPRDRVEPVEGPAPVTAPRDRVEPVEGPAHVTAPRDRVEPVEGPAHVTAPMERVEPAPAKRRHGLAILSGAVLGAIVGAAPLALMPLLDPPPARDEAAAKVALKSAELALIERDLDEAERALEVCVSLDELEPCARRLAILRALRGR